MIDNLNICVNFCVISIMHDGYYKYTYILEYLKKIIGNHLSYLLRTRHSI